MDRYLAQKADDALKAMCGTGSHEERVRGALAHLGSIPVEQIEEAPDDVQAALRDGLDVRADELNGDAAERIAGAIRAILEEWGAQNSRYMLE